MFIERPLLVAVAAEPGAVRIMPLVGEAGGDAVAGEGPHFLDEAIIQLLLPLAGQEGDDSGAAGQELRAVSPGAAFGVGQGHAGRVAGVPGVLGHAGLAGGGFGGEGRTDGGGAGGGVGWGGGLVVHGSLSVGAKVGWWA